MPVPIFIGAGIPFPFALSTFFIQLAFCRYYYIIRSTLWSIIHIDVAMTSTKTSKVILNEIFFIWQNTRKYILLMYYGFRILIVRQYFYNREIHTG